MERGIALRDSGNHEGAVAEYKKAIALVPEANVPHRFAAESLAALKRWDEAIASWV
jgi:tetratricopeptide (TPR) repeat protein